MSPSRSSARSNEIRVRAANMTGCCWRDIANTFYQYPKVSRSLIHRYPYMVIYEAPCRSSFGDDGIFNRSTSTSTVLRTTPLFASAFPCLIYIPCAYAVLLIGNSSDDRLVNVVERLLRDSCLNGGSRNGSLYRLLVQRSSSTSYIVRPASDKRHLQRVLHHGWEQVLKLSN